MNTVAGLTDYALKASGEDKAPYYLNPNNFNSTIGFGDSNCVLNIVQIFAAVSKPEEQWRTMSTKKIIQAISNLICGIVKVDPLNNKTL